MYMFLNQKEGKKPKPKPEIVGDIFWHGGRTFREITISLTAAYKKPDKNFTWNTPLKAGSNKNFLFPSSVIAQFLFYLYIRIGAKGHAPAPGLIQK